VLPDSLDGRIEITIEIRLGFDSFDQLIRPQQQRRRDGEAERLGGLEVDDQLEFRRKSAGLAPLRILST